MKRKYIVTLALLLAFTVAGTSEMLAQAKRKKVQKQQVDYLLFSFLFGTFNNSPYIKA